MKLRMGQSRERDRRDSSACLLEFEFKWAPFIMSLSRFNEMTDVLYAIVFFINKAMITVIS